ncbi:MAG: hypothetical protein ABI171_16495 [Collimonas sp.]|uniref:hypothetical protein n=1 Tax=Collimonas sp. TaxID=1963772 RepID=UPI003263BD73
MTIKNPEYHSHGQSWRLDWAHGNAEVRALGGMLGPIDFHLADGRKFQPMHQAPWLSENPATELKGLLAGLRGEWPCVPFGCAEAPLHLPPDWKAQIPDDLFGHGFAAHHDWQLSQASPGIAGHRRAIWRCLSTIRRIRR